MSAPLRRGRALARQRLLGIAFLMVITVLVGLAVALYQKAFTPVVHVTLEADRIGNQLSRGADVKVRGVLVGEVRGVSSHGDGARLELALDPQQAARLPRNVTAQLLPKTLFGEKLVVLDLPARPEGASLREGDVIAQNRTRTAMETETAVNDLLPLLKALNPQDVSTTLNALSTALRDRGDKLGANLQRTGAYLARLNPHLPTLQQDLAGLADFANSTAEATPALLQVLDNLSFSSRSAVQQQQQIDTFLTTTTTFAASAEDLVRRNEKRLVTLAGTSVPVLNMYAAYAAGYPCLLKSLAYLEGPITKSFGGLQPGLHLTLEATADNGGYVQGMEPRYGDTGGETCRGLDPAHPEMNIPLYYNPYDGYYDGQVVDPYTGKPPCTHDPCAYPPKGGRSDGAMRAAAAPFLGVRPDQVPDVTTVLLAPLARGATLSLS
jgi:phospholipid/cholesterol/gamma-HCH transport system substrate-binding protein